MGANMTERAGPAVDCGGGFLRRWFGLALIAPALVLAAAAPAPADDAVEVAALIAAGDAGAGEAVFKKCRACHEIGEGAKNKVGPRLTGVIGRPAGSIDGFEYSNGVEGAAEKGLVWGEDTVFAYIADPRAFLREFTGNPKAKAKMTFKLKDEQDRANVIAYLKSFE
jgi:cytochrome c2